MLEPGCGKTEQTKGKDVVVFAKGDSQIWELMVFIG